MKAKLTIAAALLCIGMAAIAQGGAPFWVIESNAHTAFTFIRFYDQHNTLIRQDTVVGKKLVVTKRTHRKFLDRKLKEALQQQAIASGKMVSQD